MKPTTPGNQTSEWRATLVALLTIPGLGTALILFRDALLSRPWPFVTLAIVIAVVTISWGWQRTWLKAQMAKLPPSTPPTAVILALLLTPSLAFADMGPAYLLRQQQELELAPYAIAGLWTGTFITARCWRHVKSAAAILHRRVAPWKVGTLLLIFTWSFISSVARADTPPPSPAPIRGPVILMPPDVPATVVHEPTDAAKVQAVLAGFNAGLQAAQQGITSTPILKSWTETRAGQIVMGCIAGAIVVSSAGGVAIGTALAFGK